MKRATMSTRRFGALLTLVAATVLAVGLLSWVGAKPAEAAFPGSTGDIAFIKDNGPNDMLYRVGADGYGPSTSAVLYTTGGTLPGPLTAHISS